MTSSTVSRVSVVIPTIGRGELLRTCLGSVLACDPPADEIVVIDQSLGMDVEEVVAQAGRGRIRTVRCTHRGIARATNRGLDEAAHDLVAVTHDDCTVARDWVGVARRLSGTVPGSIVTGRVLPPDGAYVPSIRTSTEPEDFTGRIVTGVLSPHNMVLHRSSVLEFGGFDEREGLQLAAEDADLCYRWLRAGRSLRYEPELLVWHRDWRTREQLIQTHVTYKRSQGVMYAKHLRAGDRHILPMVWRDLRSGFRNLVAGYVKGWPRWHNPEREAIPYLVIGVVEGWLEARRLERTSADMPWADHRFLGPWTSRGRNSP